MDNIVTIIITAIAALTVGFLIAKMLEKNNASTAIASAKKEAANILKNAEKEGESLKKDKMLQAKERFIELKSEHEKVINSRERKMVEAEKRTRDKESQISSELARGKKANQELENKKKSYDDRLAFIEKKQLDLDKMHKSQVEQLEVISSLSADDAKNQLMETLKDEAKTAAMGYIQNSVEEAKMTAQQEAKKIIISTIQRICTEESVENCVSVFNLESDDVK